MRYATWEEVNHFILTEELADHLKELFPQLAGCNPAIATDVVGEHATVKLYWYVKGGLPKDLAVEATISVDGEDVIIPFEHHHM